uniref:Uncharacterized protein n=1 Tax=Glossina morsitans morsitans TaxID=37546 RepID=A0A1B0GA19_GLOMM
MGISSTSQAALKSDF